MRVRSLVLLAAPLLALACSELREPVAVTRSARPQADVGGFGTWASGAFAFIDNAHAVGTIAQLTPAGGPSAGAVWALARQHLAAGFSTTFQLRMTKGPDCWAPADGMAFVIQNDPRGAGAIGGAGGGMGYAGVAPSLVIEFDTWQNLPGDFADPAVSDPDDHHVSVQPNGDPSPAASLGSYSFPSPINDGQWHEVTITYSGIAAGKRALAVRVDGDSVLGVGGLNLRAVGSAEEPVVDSLGGGFVGLTAATGIACEAHEVQGWTLTENGTPPTITLPALPSNIAFNHPLQFDVGAVVLDSLHNIASMTMSMNPAPHDSIARFAFLLAGPTATGHFSWTPALADSGTYWIRFTATDSRAMSVRDSLRLAVVDGIARVVVFDSMGNRAPGYVVTVVNRQFGPFTRPGDYTSYSAALTDGFGVAVIRGLPLADSLGHGGDYCVLARPLSSLASATGAGNFIAPLTVDASTMPTPANPGAGVVSIGLRADSLLTGGTYSKYCYAGSPTPAPFTLKPSANVMSPTLSLGRADSIHLIFLNLRGDSISAPAWVVQAIATPPWADSLHGLPSGLPRTGLRPGLLLTAGPPLPVLLPPLRHVVAVASASATGRGVDLYLPRVPVTIESGIVQDPDQGMLTFTLHDFTSTGAHQSLSAVLEPLICTLNRHTHSAAGRTNGVLFTAPIKDGYRANYGPPLTPRGDLAILYKETGAGNAALRLRVTVAGVDYNLNARYTTDGTTGALTAENGTAYDLGVRGTPFFAALPGNQVQVSWTVAGVRAGAAVSYGLSSQGDQFPDPSRNGASSSLQAIPFASACQGGQGNDDQWWLP